MTVEAEIRTPIAIAALIHVPSGDLHEIAAASEFHLYLRSTARVRASRGCYAKHWWPQRFERLGELFLVPPGETLRIQRIGHATERWVLCQLDVEQFCERLGAPFVWDVAQLHDSLDVRSAHLRSLMLRMREELEFPGLNAADLLEAMARQVAVELVRYRIALQERTSSGGLAPWRLQLVETRLQAMQPPPTLAALARECCMSVRQLTRAFRASRGLSIGKYLEEGRLQHVRTLLKTEQSVKSIALSVGMTPAAFSFGFKRQTGETPTEFRTRQQWSRGQPSSPSRRN